MESNISPCLADIGYEGQIEDRNIHMNHLQSGLVQTSQYHRFIDENYHFDIDICLQVPKMPSKLQKNQKPDFLNISNNKLEDSFNENEPLNMQMKNDDVPSLPHTCTEKSCYKIFKTSSDLKRHMARHKRSREHKCQVCTSSFLRSDELKRHILIHQDDKPFKCTFCDYKCVQSYDLIKHNRAHSQEKPFQCDKCRKFFTRRSGLNTHQKLHLGEEYSCEFCHRVFTTDRALKKHVKRHIDKRPLPDDINTNLLDVDKPYRCKTCQKDFKSIRSFQHHLKLIHNSHDTSSEFHNLMKSSEEPQVSQYLNEYIPQKRDSLSTFEDPFIFDFDQDDLLSTQI